MIAKVGNGIFIRYQDKSILIDPGSIGRISFKPDIILISHAHTDHVNGLKGAYKRGIKVVLSRETYDILIEMGYKIHPEDLMFVKSGDNVDLNGIHLSVYNAGHIIGSCMFTIELDRVKVGYTGDFNYEDSVILQKADMIDSDILLIDATYGHPLFSFPPREILYRMIRRKLKELVELGHVPVLHGYALGKGQELTRIAYDFVGGVISVTKSVARFNKIYENYKRKSLGNYVVGYSGDVYVKDFRHLKKVESEGEKIIFSGWVSRYKRGGFTLSSHSGFTKIIDYIVRVDPDFVIPLYNNASFLARLINRELGIKAETFKDGSKIKEIMYNVSLRGL